MQHIRITGLTEALIITGALVFFSAALAYYISKLHRLHRYTAVPAVLIRQETIITAGGDPAQLYRNYYSYTYNGKEYHSTADSTVRTADADTGRQCTVWISPADPGTAVTEYDKYADILGIVLSMLILLVVLGYGILL